MQMMIISDGVIVGSQSFIVGGMMVILISQIGTMEVVVTS
tara:strand:+ start:1676 stop:1795 length:120 start_codon:yes stop_codon:yes gene_type:complete